MLPAPKMRVAPMPIAEPRPLVDIMKINAIRLILPFAFGSRAAAPETDNKLNKHLIN